MIIQAIIEIPTGSNYKYEIDKDTSELVLDRVLQYNLPANYGYIPNTMSPDGDPLDIFIISKLPLVPKSRVKVNIIGVLKCLDNGVEDDKIISTLVGDCDGYYDNGFSYLYDIRFYLNNYKEGFNLTSDLLPLEEAMKLIEESYVKT